MKENLSALLEQHPKVTELVKKFLMERFVQSWEEAKESLPPDFKAHLEGFKIENRQVENLLSGQPRALFDFFDSHELYIVVDYSLKLNMFQYKMYFKGEEIKKTSIKYPFRRDVEWVAISAAFKHLEQFLNENA